MKRGAGFRTGSGAGRRTLDRKRESAKPSGPRRPTGSPIHAALSLYCATAVVAADTCLNKQCAEEKREREGGKKEDTSPIGEHFGRAGNSDRDARINCGMTVFAGLFFVLEDERFFVRNE